MGKLGPGGGWGVLNVEQIAILISYINLLKKIIGENIYYTLLV